MKTANVLKFKRKPLPEEEKLVINRGQQKMILDYLDRCMAGADDSETAEQFSAISSMVFCFCLPQKEGK